MAKAKNKTKTRQVNFNNPKTMQTIRYLQLAENRLKRQEMLAITGKDIFYQLKNNGFIKEDSKGIFQGTNKLHNHMKKLDGSTFSKSNSTEHSNKILKTIQFLPKEIITEARFQTGTDLQKEYQKQKHQREYKELLKQEKETLQRRIQELSTSYKELQQLEHDQVKKLQATFNYRMTMESLERTIEVLKENNFSPPDYSVELTKTEGEDYLSNLIEYRDSLEKHTKEYDIYSKAVEKMEHLITDENIILGIEIVTNNYGSLDMEKHYLYERIMKQNVIYIT